MPTIYRSRAGERDLLAQYDAALRALPRPTESRFVPTRSGRTHLLMMGRVTAPPLLLLPGGNFLSPTTLGWFAPLAATYRLYTPDLLGQPGLSDATPLATSGDEHARWLTDLLDQLALGPLPIVGISYGGGMALRLAGYDPARITALGLVAPAGLIMGPIGPIVRQILLPMLAYRWQPTAARLDRATRPLLSEPNPLLAEQIGLIYRHLRLQTSLPRNATAEELRQFDAPTLIIANECDPFFPAARLLARAQQIIPNLVETMTLPGQSHIATAANFATINSTILAFLQHDGRQQ